MQTWRVHKNDATTQADNKGSVNRRFALDKLFYLYMISLNFSHFLFEGIENLESSPWRSEENRRILVLACLAFFNHVVYTIYHSTSHVAAILTTNSFMK
jgi:hypothetical protein